MAFSRASSARRYAAEELMNYAVRLLGGRALTLAELRAKLEARAADPADVAPLLERLTESRLVSDESFAESFTTARRDLRLHGAARVRRDLAQRKVPRPVAEAALREAFEGVDETAHAAAWLERKLRVPDPAAWLADPAHLRSIFGKLRRAGFSGGAAIAALRRFSTAAAELAEIDEPDPDSPTPD